MVFLPCSKEGQQSFISFISCPLSIILQMLDVVNHIVDYKHASEMRMATEKM